MTRFYPRLYVHSLYNAGLSFALLFLLRRICSELCIFDQFHTMLSAAQHIVPLHACNFARQPCTEALPGSPIPNTAQNTALLSNFTMLSAYCMQPCPVALPASLARKPYPPALPASLAEKLFYGRRPACMQYIAYFYSAGSLVQAFPAIKDIAILSLVY
jgi:hypothetical protein